MTPLTQKLHLQQYVSLGTQTQPAYAETGVQCSIIAEMETIGVRTDSTAHADSIEFNTSANRLA